MSTEMQTYQGEEPLKFNPNEHIMQIKNKNGSADYLPVQWRLVWFREHCPNGTIDTEEIVVDLDRECEAEVYVWNQDMKRSEKVLKRAPGYARFRAVVTDGRGGRATGTKTERGVDFPDFVEKAETGAIGRALAGLGYGTQFAPELDEEERIVDAPVEKRRKATEQEKQAYQQRKPFVEGSVAVKEEKQVMQPTSTINAPLPSQLRKRVAAMKLNDSFEAIVLKVLKMNKPDDNMTPEDCNQIKMTLDAVDAKRAAKQEPAKTA